MKHNEQTLRERLYGTHWLWWGLAAVALVAAVAYLRVTLLAPLGGDDQYGNLNVYVQLTKQGP